MVFVHNLIQEIINVQLRPRINDSLYLVQQFIELDTLSDSNVVKSHLPLNSQNNRHL